MEKSFDFEYLGKMRKREVFFNPEGLDSVDCGLVEEIGIRVIKKAQDEDVLDRCTFFAEPGLKALEEIVSETPKITEPEIRGCDSNVFKQHYWVEFTLKKGMRKVIIDPIFGYVGLLSKSLNTSGNEYYKHSRHVIPRKHFSEGGVNINTNRVM